MGARTQYLVSRQSELLVPPAIGVHAVAVQLDLRRLLAVFAAVLRSGGHSAVAAGMGALRIGLLVSHGQALLRVLSARALPGESSARSGLGPRMTRFAARRSGCR